MIQGLLFLRLEKTQIERMKHLMANMVGTGVQDRVEFGCEVRLSYQAPTLYFADNPVRFSLSPDQSVILGHEFTAVLVPGLQQHTWTKIGDRCDIMHVQGSEFIRAVLAPTEAVHK